MPTSTNYFKEQTKNYINSKFEKNINILDVGAGIGTYANLLKPLGYTNIDCVEVFEKYVEDYSLRTKYRNVFLYDITKLEIDFTQYDLIIFGDVLEHIEKSDAVKLMSKINNIPCIVCVPFESPQGEHFGNIYETHLQPDLTFENFLESFGNFHPLCVRFDYGVFVNEEPKEIFFEVGERQLPNNYLKLVVNNYQDSEYIYLNPPQQSEISVKNKDSKVTIVTALWDLGRGQINESFKRGYDDYIEKFGQLLRTDVNMYIFCDQSDEDYIWTIRSKENTVLNLMSLEQLKKWFNFTDLTSKISEKPEWLSQSGWLPESPQAKLDGYNPLVMSKMFMLNNVTIWNPFNSENFFWIDAGITNTVNPGYFTHDRVFNNLNNFLDVNGEFIFISYPYIGGNEIHGFSRPELARYCNTDYVRYVCRGGFFGGRKTSINEINGIYYGYLNSTLNDGLMGTEESIFTIVSHNHSEKIYRFEISDNGLIWPFFEELKNYKEIKDNTTNEFEPQTLQFDPTFLIDKIVNTTPTIQTPQEEVALYVIGFNSPNQFKTLIHSMLSYDKNFIEKPKKYLLDNSTDLSTTEQYLALCNAYGFEHIKKNNIGITGGRQWIAEHFNDSGHKYYFFFEDDMFFSDDKYGHCRNGFGRYVPNMYDKLISLIKKEKFDFIKMNYSEFFGDNGTQWAWYNVPQHFRQLQWPENSSLPQQGLDPNSPKTKYDSIKSFEGLPYTTGEVFYCNWPQIMSKEGNKKCFIDTKFASPYEQTLMSFIFQETVKGVIKPALLLLSPTEHNRFEHYDASLRKEC